MQRSIEQSAILGEATVAPGESKDILVGIYENLIPQPELTVEHTGHDDNFEASLKRQEDNGDYTLVYHLTNRGNAILGVTIRCA